jgi:hypothetical protein
LWHISNVETWVSTALTDASSCVQSFPGHRMSKRVATIKIKAKNVAEVTSNALALFHSYASSYKQAAARATKKPWKIFKKFAYFFTLCLFMYINIHVFSLGGFILLLIKCNICKISLCFKKELCDFNIGVYYLHIIKASINHN